MNSTEPLRREAQIIHRVLFACEAPDELADQYARALESATLSDWPPIDIADAAARGADIEAIELAARRTNVRNAVTQRFQVVCYLAETRPERFASFVNDRPDFLRGMIALTSHAIRSVAQSIKGRRLLRMHALR